ncbi:four-helix bundle copper-binding protein [Streptomyces bikiniensis]|uniref:Four-helix bundle copper-binding protein n=1 Tax=Streptomyces bikiniensis TaxID=1896 RepID=A0ABW8CYC4_STRBI
MHLAKVGQQDKDDPAQVARQGLDALFAGKNKIVAGSVKTKAQAAADKVLPDSLKAEAHRRTAEPGSGDEAQGRPGRTAAGRFPVPFPVLRVQGGDRRPDPAPGGTRDQHGEGHARHLSRRPRRGRPREARPLRRGVYRLCAEACRRCEQACEDLIASPS